MNLNIERIACNFEHHYMVFPISCKLHPNSPSHINLFKVMLNGLILLYYTDLTDVKMKYLKKKMKKKFNIACIDYVCTFVNSLKDKYSIETNGLNRRVRSIHKACLHVVCLRSKLSNLHIIR